MLLHEKYRPSTWSDVVGQDKVVKVIRSFGNKTGYGGRAYFISDASGSGKTTIARLIAAEVANPICIEEMDASELTAERMREISANIHQYGWGKGGKAYIVNEVHGLSAPTVRRLLCLLEPDRGGIPSHIVFVFTTTVDGLDLFEDHINASPLFSRCTCLSLARRDVAQPFAARVRECLAKDGMNGQPIDWYIKLARECKNNMRAMYELAERRIAEES